MRDADPLEPFVVDVGELAEAVASPGEQTFVFDYVRSSTDSFLMIYRADGRVCYRRYAPVRYNMKPKDFAGF